MKVGLISDTHIPSTSPEPPSQVAQAFGGVSLILHAGDIYVASCLDWLERIAPVQAVEQSPGPYWEGDDRVAERRVVKAEGFHIGLVHDLRLPGMTTDPRPGTLPADFSLAGSLPREVRRFFGSAVDVVVFGHTHEPLVERHQGVLLVNPGSAALPGQIRRLGTVAILDLTSAGADARIIDLAQLR